MEDMAWVLYALLGTQALLLFLIWRIGAAVVGEIKSVHGTLVDVGGKENLSNDGGILVTSPWKPSYLGYTGSTAECITVFG